MDNHVHIIAVPRHPQALTRCFAETHKRYTKTINRRYGWRGYLWQGRFHSFPMHERYLYAAVRYVERNPVEAGMVRQAQDYWWSSARAHVLKIKDPLLSPCFLEEEIQDWAAFLGKEEGEVKVIEKHLRTGRPFGDTTFITDLERRLGKRLTREKPGPKTKSIVSFSTS